MLSISNLASGKYYSHENYYSKEGGVGQWQGELAQDLKLQEYSDDRFEELSKGALPIKDKDGNNIRLGRKVKGEEALKHDPGRDLTFSAPKSVSIAVEVFGDKQLINAHEKAVEDTLRHIEQFYIKTIVVEKGKKVDQTTGKMLACKFTHHTSRNSDPQLHTHCAIFNITKRADGEYRSIDTKDIFYDKLLLGKRYRFILMSELQKLGYHIKITDKDLRFELASMPQELINAFSSRSQEIAESMSQYEYINAKTKATATLMTRQEKEYKDKTELTTEWQSVVKKTEHGISHSSNALGKILKNNINLQNQHFADIGQARYNTAKIENILDSAIKDISERQATFTIKGLYDSMMNFASDKQNIDIETMDRAIQDYKEQGKLLFMKTDKPLSENDTKDLPTGKPNASFKHNGDLQNLMNQHVYPKIYEKLPDILPEFALKKHAGHYVASNYYKVDATIGDKQGAVYIYKNNAGYIKDYTRGGMSIWDYLQKRENITNNKDMFHYLIRLADIKSHDIKDVISKAPTYSKPQLGEKAVEQINIEAKIENKTLAQETIEDIKKHFYSKYSELNLDNLQLTNSTHSLVKQTMKEIEQTVLEKSGDSDRKQLTNDMIAVLKDATKDITNADREILKSLMTTEQLCWKVIHEKIKFGNEIPDRDQHIYRYLQQERQLSKEEVLTYEFASPIKRQEVESLLRKYVINNAETQPIKNTIVTTMRNMNLLSDTSGNIYKHDHKSNILLPIRNKHGMVSGYVGRFIYYNKERDKQYKAEQKFYPSKYLYTKGLYKKELLFNLEKIDINKPVVITEGFFDAITAHKSGINAIALGSTGFNKDQLQLLRDKGVKEIILSLDNDTSGQKATDNHIKLIHKHADPSFVVRRLYMPNDIKDPDEFINIKGVEAYQKALDEAEVMTKLLKQEQATDKAIIQEAPQEIVTTPQILEQEKDTIQLMLEGQQSVKKLMTSEQALNNIHQNQKTLNLSPDQKSTIKHILNSRDQIIGIQGTAGTGKTTAIRLLNDIILKETNYRLQGLAPTASSVDSLSKGADIIAEGMQGFLHKHKHIIEWDTTNAQGFVDKCKALIKQFNDHKELTTLKQDYKNTIFIVDEASMIGTSNMRDLLAITKKIDTRIVLIGDTKQLDAVEAGTPFADLQNAGMKTAKLQTIIRQKDPIVKQAVEETIKSHIKTAMQKLHNNIYEQQDLVKYATASWYVNQGKDLLLLVPSNKLRNQINDKIRERIHLPQELKNNYIHNILVNKGLTTEKRLHAISYQNNDVIIFNSKFKKYKIDGKSMDSNKHYIVQKIDYQKNVLYLKEEASNSKAIQFKLQTNIKFDVFHHEQRGLVIGEKIRWTRNDKRHNIINSHTAIVKNITRHNIHIESNEKLIKLSKNHPSIKHLDYAYASTIHAAQGKTTDHVISVLESKHQHLTTQKSFYVAISRTRYDATIITDNAAKLTCHLQEHTGIQMSALEHQKINPANDINSQNKTKLNYTQQDVFQM